MTPEQKPRIEQSLMSTYTTILDEDVVAGIEFANARHRTDWRYPHQRKYIDTLCHEWRALRAEIAKLTTRWCECGHAKDKHGFFSDHDECYECDQASPDLCCEWRPAPRPNEADMNHDATAMRSACVEKVREMGQQWYGEAKRRGAAFSDKGRLAELIAKELESLPI